MLYRLSVLALSLFLTSMSVHADLNPYVDYQASEAVYSATTVRVNANMGDAYLEGLKNTWVAGNKLAKELGQIEDFKIFRSDLPQSGDFNLLLIVKFKNTADLGPSKEKHDAFMKKWGENRNKETTEYAQKNYPGMRTITGMYNLREITLN